MGTVGLWAAAMMLFVAPRLSAGPPGNPTSAPATAPPVSVRKPTVQLKAGQQPKIQFVSRDINFGRAPAGKIVEIDFSFTNTGTGPLEIVDIQADCGCTTSGPYDKVIEPTVTGRIPIRLSTRRLRGKIDKVVHVFTNVDGDDKHLTLFLRGEVWMPVAVTPESVSFGQMQRSAALRAPLAKFVRIDNHSETPIKPTIAHVSHPAIKPKVNPSADGKKFGVQIVLAPPFEPGVTFGTIRIATGSELLPELEIPVTAYFADDIEASPNRIGLYADRPPTQRDVQITNRANVPLSITGLESKSKQLKLSVQGSGTGPYKLLVDFPPNYRVPADGDVITFQTGYEKLPTMRIPVVVVEPGPNKAVPAVDHNEPEKLGPIVEEPAPPKAGSKRQ